MVLVGISYFIRSQFGKLLVREITCICVVLLSIKIIAVLALNREKVPDGQATLNEVLYDDYLIPSNASWPTYPLCLSHHP